MKFVVDIDNTILYSCINESGDYELLSVNDELVKKINHLYDKGHDIILFTGRHWNHLQITIQQLTVAKVRCTTLVMGKPVGDYYIDDKAILPSEFLEIADEL